MKKRFFIILIIMIFLTTAFSFYKIKMDNRVQLYLDYFSAWSKRSGYRIGLKGEVKLKKVIKKSPKELIMIIKFGDRDVYISVEDWMTKHHDTIEIHPFTKEFAAIYE